MKKYNKIFFVLLLISSLIVAQEFPYKDRWELIEQKECDGDMRSMLPLADEIYQQAKSEGGTLSNGCGQFYIKAKFGCNWRRMLKRKLF